MRQDVTFTSEGVTCAGWLYTPDSLAPGTKAPALVLANAITATREMVVPAYAERFAAAGFICLAFDFRFLGASEGTPRGQILAAAQIDDIRNAISWLSLRDEVDVERIGAWGASFGGAHVLYLSAYDRRIKAAVVAAPSMRASDTMVHFIGREGLVQVLGFLTWDRTTRYQNATVSYMKAVSDGTENAMLPNPEAFAFFTGLGATIAPTWSNQVTVESLEKLIEYDPSYGVDLISPTPLLMILGDNDQSQPPNLALDAYEKIGEPKSLVHLACGHTELLGTEVFVEQCAAASIAWLKEKLG